MQFTTHTEYDFPAHLAMAKVLRKTTRRKRDIKSRIIGIAVIILALLMMIPFDGKLETDFRFAMNGAAVVIVAAVLIFGDRMNAYLGKKNLLKGNTHADSVFTEEYYENTTPAGKSEFPYDRIAAIGETKDYFIFLFDERYAQAYDKRNLTGGSMDEFRAFIESKTGKKILKIK